MTSAVLLSGADKNAAAEMICKHHYTHSVPSGKSYYIQYQSAIVVWSIPANKNIAKFILRGPGIVWELSRLWAPDGHEKNLLSKAISKAVSILIRIENVDALVSYADPNVGHKGGVYRAASWCYHGESEESRAYVSTDGQLVSRRSFHSGSRGLTKSQIESLGYTQLRRPGKIRFVKPISRRARAVIYAAEKMLKHGEDRAKIE